MKVQEKEEKIYSKVRAYIGTIRTYLIHQIRYQLYLKYGSSVNENGRYNKHWMNNEVSKNIYFLICSLEKHRYSSSALKKDIVLKKNTYQISLESLDDFLETARENANKSEQNGLNLIYSFKHDLRKLFAESIAEERN